MLLRRHFVRSVEKFAANEYAAGQLLLDCKSLEIVLKQEDDRIKNIEISVANHGDATRIVCVKDVVQPRLRISGDEQSADIVCVVDNVAVVSTGPIVGFQEGIIDMSGPGADLTPFSKLTLVVLNFDVVGGLTPAEHEETIRRATIAAAEQIALTCSKASPDRVDEVLWQELDRASPLRRIAYVYLVLSQGLLHDTYVLGQNASIGLPMPIDPMRLLDTAIVSGNCVSACDKNTTYHHQNNPVVDELLKGHGSKWNFVGVVLTNSPTRLDDKIASASTSVDLARELGADGVIITKEGFGNPDADLMMIVRGLEQAGIKTVAITDEFAGSDGSSQSLADSVPEADAVISTGNANDLIELPAMPQTIGPLPDLERLAGGYPGTIRADGSISVELQAIIGATNELGFGRLSCREI